MASNGSPRDTLPDPIADVRLSGKVLRIIAEMERRARDAERAE